MTVSEGFFHCALPVVRGQTKYGVDLMNMQPAGQTQVKEMWRLPAKTRPRATSSRKGKSYNLFAQVGISSQYFARWRLSYEC